MRYHGKLYGKLGSKFIATNLHTDDHLIRIAEIQESLLKRGWRWREEIYNDGSPNYCYVDFTKSTDNSFFSNNSGEYGWARYSRMDVWQQAWDKLSTI